MSNILKRIFFILLVGFGSSFFLFYSYKDKKGAHKKSVVTKTENFYTRIDNLQDFKEIKGAPLSDKFNDVWSVKLVFDTESGVLYYVRSNKYKYHFNFCSEVLHYDQPLEVFNMLNYSKSYDRRFYLANLNYYTQSNYYTFEFTSDDVINEMQINRFYKEITNTFFLKDSLKLLISSDCLAKLDQKSLITIPRVYPSAIFKGQQYQILQEGKSFGILKASENVTKEFVKIEPEDILITKGSPTVIPVCAGILSNVFQTPLSHINILCHHRKIPSAVSVNIWKNNSVMKLVGKPVSLTVTKDSVIILPATMEDVELFRKSLSNTRRIILRGNIEEKSLIDVKNFGYRQREIVGNKAAGFGELYKVASKYNSSFEVPEGAFAIPFWFYKEHIESKEINEAIDLLLSIDSKDLKAIHEQLSILRKLIKSKPLNSLLLAQVIEAIQKNNVGNSYRFRSSGNAEDRAGFSGAGLYESKTGILNDSVKTIEKAIKAVWASTWNDEAFLERQAYNIDQRSVLMGILVHRNFPNEICNGVAITKNIYRKDFPGMTINVQKGEVEVVAPPDSVICEQFVCIPVSVTKMFSNDIAVDYITYSNIANGNTILSTAQIKLLFQSLDKVKMHYFNKFVISGNPSYWNFGLDIEFKFDKNNKLYLKQVRPYY